MESTLGKRIMAHRKKLGLTQDKLAEIIGVTPQAVSKWENDQSCPDITALPQLADIFGITTDELLGRDVQERNNCIDATTEEPDTQSGHGFEWQYESGKWGALMLAIFVLAVGVLTFASKILQWDVSFWEILWPCAILIIGLGGLLHKFTFFNTGCILVGGYFLLDNLNVIQWSISKDLIFPILILLFGITLLMDALKKPLYPRQTFHHIGKGGKFENHFHTDGEQFTCSLTFGESHRQVDLPRLQTGNISCSFGELVVDLTQCKEFADNCHITAMCSFGELELIVPKHIRVEHDSNTAFASVDVRGLPSSDASVTLQLDARVSFGQLVVRYI